MIKNLILLITILALTWSCQEVIQVDLDEGQKRLVVEGRIEKIKNKNSGYQSLTLSQTSDYFSNSQTPRVSGASVSVSDEDGNVRFIQPVVDQQAARERLGRQRFKRSRRILRTSLSYISLARWIGSDASRSPDFDRPLPYLEVVWLPCYRVSVETLAKGESRPIDVLVGDDEQFRIIDRVRQGHKLKIDNEVERRFTWVLKHAKSIKKACEGKVLRFTWKEKR